VSFRDLEVRDSSRCGESGSSFENSMGFINGRWICHVPLMRSYSNDHGDWNVLHKNNLLTYNETRNVITE
jgi:hypothetical protein